MLPGTRQVVETEKKNDANLDKCMFMTKDDKFHLLDILLDYKNQKKGKNAGNIAVF